MKYSGEIIRSGGSTDYYAVYIHESPKYHLCHKDEMCRRTKSYPDEFVGWGYEGSGPAQLALMLTWHGIWRTEHPNPDKFYWKMSAEKRISILKSIGQRAIQHHLDFMREFVANWGDTWEIDTDEIYRWMKEREAREQTCNSQAG